MLFSLFANEQINVPTEIATVQRTFSDFGTACTSRRRTGEQPLLAFLVYSSSCPSSHSGEICEILRRQGSGPWTVAHPFIYFLTYRCTRSCSRFIGAGSSPLHDSTQTVLDETSPGREGRQARRNASVTTSSR